jgi:hypothetical protein
VHLEKLHERPANGHIVFDNEHRARSVFCHVTESVYRACQPTLRVRRRREKPGVCCGIVRRFSSLQGP